jgi:hypothetical protein
MTTAAHGMARLLRPGGMVLFRDYAEGDMRMNRFVQRDSGGGTHEEGRLYVRGDQTLAYFFKVDEVCRLFEAAGLVTVECRVEDRFIENRKTGEVMKRRWLIGRFQKPECVYARGAEARDADCVSQQRAAE